MSRPERWLQKACVVLLAISCFSIGALAVGTEEETLPQGNTTATLSTSVTATHAEEPTTAADSEKDPSLKTTTTAYHVTVLDTTTTAHTTTKSQSQAETKKEGSTTSTKYKANAITDGDEEDDVEPENITDSSSDITEAETTKAPKDPFVSKLLAWIWLPIFGILGSIGGLVFLNARYFSEKRRRGGESEDEIFSSSRSSRHSKTTRHGRRPR